MTEPSDDEPPARYVGVGIGTYKEYPPLPGASVEAKQVADLLASKGVQTVVAAATTEPELIAELARVLPPRPEGGGALVVLWAGHGDRLPDASLRLVAQDTVKKGAPLLTPEYVASVAVRSGANQLLLIFDTCFSGGGALPVLEGADRWFSGQVGPPGKRWLGVLASAMDWEKARDDLFGDRLARLLRDGPTREDLRLRWSAQNAGIRGDDLIDALQKEWADDAPHRPKAAQFGNPWVLLPNPRHDPAAPPRVVEHLLLAARGGEPEDETWYFTGRHAVITRLVSWIAAGQPGMHVVTGPAGSGKSAILGLVVCLSNPEQRAALLARGPLDYADPGVESVHAHIYARGLARNQLVRELDIQLSDAGVLSADRRSQRGAGELADAVAASAIYPVIVIDGLDEAGLEAWPIAEDVLRPLARHAVVLVGTRDLAPPDDGETLVTRLQSDSTEVVHLLEEVDDATDVHDYVIRRLRDVDASAMDVDQIADAILALPAGDEEGRFLLARVITAQLRANPVDTTRDGWQQHLSTSVEDALDRDLAALPARIRGQDSLPAAGSDLLAALAWAQGGGLPDDIWPLIATAISVDGTQYTRDDAYWALTAAGRYIVEAGEAGHAVYRLSHQRLAQHLRNKVSGGGVQDAELRIADTLVTTYQALLEAGVAPIDHPYLWRYTWRHCADAGTAGITALRRLVDLDRNEFLLDFALASRYMAGRQVEAGRLFEAVGPAEDTVAAYRELAERNPAYLPDLASALNNLGNHYSDVGRRADAVAPVEEAVTLYRAQAEANPAYLPELASALNNLGNRYSDVGRRADAVAPTEEAVTLYRAQAEANPAYLPDLAMVRGNLGIRYSEVGRRADAVAPAEEAVTLYRAQAEANPAYLPNLAGALNNLGNRYSDVGRRADAVAPVEEAVSLRRAQAEANPAYLPDLASALNNLGNRYSEVGRRADAVAPTEEAVTLYRAQAEANPAYLPDLAMVLGNLGNRYSEVGRRADAVAPGEEAVTLYRAQAEANPAYLPDLARELGNLGASYSEVGRRADAVAPAEEAVTLYRAQAEANPAYLPELARALNNLGASYSEVGRRADAVAPAEEAVTLYRAQAEANPAYLPNLAATLNNLGNRYSQVGRRADAVAPTEEAVALRRAQAEANPAYLPNLAATLNNLGNRYSDVGRRADAVAPAEEAVTLYRAQAEANPAYLPELASALGNLGNHYSEVGRRADAVAPAEEAVTLYRAQAENNPAYLPNLAAALGNLGIRYSEVGRRADAVAPAEEAVTLYRAQAENNPAYLPELARALNNLGIRYSEVGRRADAVAPAEEAVTLYRAQAENNPAYLPNLASALGNLGEDRLDAGLPWDADAAWSSTLDAMPTSELKAGLLLEKAHREAPREATGDVLTALTLTPPVTGSTLFSLHSACRELRNSDQGLFDQVWQERLKIDQPPWLLIDDAILTTTGDWLDTPTHTEARNYHSGHAEVLARPQAGTALDELALLGYNPDLISQYHQLLTTASEQGIQRAYQHLVVSESLAAWLNANIPEKQQLLHEDREILLSDEATELLARWSAEDPGNQAIRFGAAMLSLARDGLETEVLTALDEPGQLNTLLGELFAAGKPRQLRAAAEFLLYLDLDQQTLASAQLHLAIALTLTGHPDDAPEHARTAGRLDPDSVNRWVGFLAQHVPARPELADLIQTLVTAPDDPHDTGSHHRASPGS
jgi:hypothetical protein